MAATLPLLLSPRASAATFHAGDLVVAAVNDGGTIYRLRPINGEEEMIAQLHGAGVVDIGVAMDAEGNIFAAYGEKSRTGVVARVSATKGTVKVLTRGKFLVDPVAVTLGRDGHLLVLDTEALSGAGGIVHVNARSGLQTMVSSSIKLGNPQGLVLEADGEALVTDPGALGGPGLVRVNLKRGAQAKLASRGEMRAPVGVALASNGDVIVSDARATGRDLALKPDGSLTMSSAEAPSRGAILRIHPKTGAQKIICSGGDFGEPQAIVVGQADDLFVVDRRAFKERGGVIRVNLANGAQTARYPAWRCNDPRSITVVPGSQPDLQIRKSWDFGYSGDNLYGTDGKDQTRAQTASVGDTCVFNLRLQNDGKFTDSFVLQGRTSAPGFALKYFLAGGRDEAISSDVTSEEEMTHILRDIAPGDARVVRVEIAVRDRKQARLPPEEAFVFTASSANDRAKQDAVKAVVQVKR